MSEEKLSSILQKANQRLRRSNLWLFLVAVVCAALSAYFFTDAHSMQIRLDNARSTLFDERDQLTTNRRSLDATLDALRHEQELAGRFESERNNNWDALMTSERHRVLVEQWFNSYRRQHGDAAVNWNAYYRGLDK